MDDASRLTSLQAALCQPQRGLYFAPIRHHSPACAWAVKQLIAQIRPAQILIEAPVDLQHHIDLLLDPDTRPPVALAVLVDREEQARLAAYYPFCAHSPEYVALQQGKSIGAQLQFIDLPSGDKALSTRATPDQPIHFDTEHYFDTGDFINAMCRRIGCRNGYELWDHLFESRLGEADWQSFFADVGAYCAALREATPPAQIKDNGDTAREQHMAAAIQDALSNDGPVLVLTGGFHTPALVDAVAQGDSRRPPTGASATVNSFVIRYGFAALDAQSGYAAGLPQPGYYDYLWRRADEAKGSPQWRETALALLTEFARELRADGHSIAVPTLVEVLRVAEGLAAMRGRQGAARYDLIDALRTALVKGEVGVSEVWTERLLLFLRGNAIGDVPASAGSPPIVEDARAQAKRLRIDVSDGARRQRRLDIRRKSSHLRASRYFHAMTLLDTGFAEHQAGPDFVNGINTDRLFEEWSYAWSPMVEGRLIELAMLGDKLNSVCVGVLQQQLQQKRESGHSRDIIAMADLLVRGVLAGLGADLAEYMQVFAGDIKTHGDFHAVAQTLRRLHNMSHASGPLGLPSELALDELQQAAYQRLIYLCDDLPKTPPEAIAERMEALRLVTGLLRSQQQLFDRSVFDEAINRVAMARPPAEILGCVLAITVLAGLREPDDICVALSGSFNGTAENDQDRVGVLRGVLFTTPEILWRHERVLREIDQLLCGIADEDFLQLLPHVRLAFTALNPREADRVAESLASLHGGRSGEFTRRQTELTERDLQKGLALQRAVSHSLAADGLSDWLKPL